MWTTFGVAARARFVGQLPGHDSRVFAVAFAVDGVGAGNDRFDNVAIQLLRFFDTVEGRGVFHERIPFIGNVRVEYWLTGKPGYVLRHAAGPLPEVVEVQYSGHVALGHFLRQRVPSRQQRLVIFARRFEDGRTHRAHQFAAF